MKKFIILLVFSIIIVSGAFAQITLGLGLGATFSGFREETDTPINRYVNALTYSIMGSIEKNSFLHTFNLMFYMGDANVAREYREFHNTYDYRFFRGKIDYALDYSLWNIMNDERFPGYLGGAFFTDVSYFFDTSGYMDSPKFNALISLAVHATQRWIINSQNSLTLSAAIPLFTYAVRPAFAGVDELWSKYASEAAYFKIFGLGKFGSIHNYWALYSNIMYSYQLNSLISFNGGLGLEISHINIPKDRPRRDAVLRLNAGIAFTF